MSVEHPAEPPSGRLTRALALGAEGQVDPGLAAHGVAAERDTPPAYASRRRHFHIAVDVLRAGGAGGVLHEIKVVEHVLRAGQTPDDVREVIA